MTRMIVGHQPSEHVVFGREQVKCKISRVVQQI